MTASDVTQESPVAPASAPDAVSPVGHQRGVLHQLTVAQLERITEDSVAITFSVPDELREEFSYLPGQHVAVRATIAGDDVRRNYSICAPAGSGVLRIGVKRLPGGVFSGYALERLSEGDSVEVLAPSGTFTIAVDHAASRHIAAVAAGSGITPVLSILSSVLRAEPNSRATLIYVNKNTSSIMFLEDLEDLKNEHMDRFTILNVLDGEDQEAALLSGRLDADRLTAIVDSLVYPDVDEWFLCGPLAMTDMVRATLTGRGVPQAAIRRELFHVAATAPLPAVIESSGAPADVATVTVRLDGRTTSFTLAPNTDSILNATLRLRGEVPYACKNGVCGTCRCLLISGEVDMVQNFALEQDEVARGYRLACQSYPSSPDVVVDFDQ